ncbi:MAG: protein kinase, partial [Thermoanaerobaculia bacterium]|nr:protein kinase [Thermoanaerobaculia bacterium]
MDKIGKYDIVRQIGEGGFGVVYEGLDPFLKRRVAIKTCTSEAKELRERFYREAEIAGKLQHRHIVTVHDFGVHDEVPYLVQEFLSGHDLDTIIARRTVLSSDRRLEILLDVAKGLEHAHTKGVIHRDIKPGNIRVLDDASAKILDFGIAKLANVASHLTRTGMTVGTAAYLPPEQIRGAEVDHRADIFSFGVTAYELLSGERPYTGNTISKLFYQLLNEAPTPMNELWPECPPELADVVERCLRKDPGERFGSFGEVIRSLNRVQAAMRRESDKMSGGTTNILTTGKGGLTSLGQALVDDEDVASGQFPTEIEIEAEEPTDQVDPGTRVVTWARQLLSEGDPAAAQEALRLFLAETPKHAEASTLLAEVSKQLNDERLTALTSEVESALTAGESAQARVLLADAEREGFTSDQLARLFLRVEAVEKEANTARDSELANKAKELRELAGQKDFGRALRLLEALERHYGDHPELATLGAEVRSAREKEVATHVAAVREALASDSVDPASQALAALRRLDPENVELDQLAEAVEEKRSVDKRVGDILKRVQELIREGHLEAAFTALKAAETQHGGGPFVELQQRVRELRREKLEREVAASIGEGRRHLQKGELPATVAAIEKALAIDPDNQEALAVLKAAQSRLRGPGEADQSVKPDDFGGVIDQATVKLTSQQIRAAEEQAAAEEALRIRTDEAKRARGEETASEPGATDRDGRKQKPSRAVGESSSAPQAAGTPGTATANRPDSATSPIAPKTASPIVPPSSASSTRV